MTIQEFLGTIVANFGSFGIVTWLAAAIAIQYREHRGFELTNDQKRWVSVGVGIIIVAAAYTLGVLLGFWPFNQDTLFKAIFPIFGELGGSKIIFAATKSAENRKKVAALPRTSARPRP